MSAIWLALSWLLYGLGDAVSRTMAWWEPLGTPLYPLYNWLMLSSVDAQNHAGLSGPWKRSQP